jgi:hypothetical protein
MEVGSCANLEHSWFDWIYDFIGASPSLSPFCLFTTKRPKDASKKPSNENLIVSGILCKLSRSRRQNIQICSAITVLPLFVRLPFHSSNYKQFTLLIIGRKAKKNAFLLCKQNVKMLVMGMNKREYDEVEMQTREFRGNQNFKQKTSMRGRGKREWQVD